jgi:hypothetical protein
MRRDAGLVCAVAVAALAVALLCTPRARSDDAVGPPELWLRVGTLHVGDGSVQRDVTLRLHGGVIASLGREAPPDGADVRDLSTAHVTPGWIDAVTQLGVRGGAAESVEVLTPGVRAADAFDPESPALGDLAGACVTSFGVGPAPVNVSAGRAV